MLNFYGSFFTLMTYTITFRTNAHYTRPKIELIAYANNILGLRLIADWIIKPLKLCLHAPPCITFCTDLPVPGFYRLRRVFYEFYEFIGIQAIYSRNCA